MSGQVLNRQILENEIRLRQLSWNCSCISYFKFDTVWSEPLAESVNRSYIQQLGIVCGMDLEGSGLTHSLLSVQSFGVTKGKLSANWTLYIYSLNRSILVDLSI
jgi:hypothetical protein